MDKSEVFDALDAIVNCNGRKCDDCKYYRRVPCKPGSCEIPDDDEIFDGALELLKEYEEGMDLNAYQKMAARTINPRLNKEEKLRHSLFEMCGELGEIHSIYQKVYQGHQIKVADLQLEVGDLLWGIAEFCTVNGWSLASIARQNIEKLQKRYPDGFKAENSVNRETP